MTLAKSTGDQKVNLDFNKEFINTFSAKIQSADIQFINQTLKDLHESDVANLIENLSNETRTKLIELLLKNIPSEKLIFNSELIDIKNQDKLSLCFRDKKTEEFDFLVAADGIYSKTKQILFKEKACLGLFFF